MELEEVSFELETVSHDHLRHPRIVLLSTRGSRSACTKGVVNIAVAIEKAPGFQDKHQS